MKPKKKVYGPKKAAARRCGAEMKFVPPTSSVDHFMDELIQKVAAQKSFGATKARMPSVEPATRLKLK